MAANGENVSEKSLWVPDVYREVLIDETNPALQVFAEQARDDVSTSRLPRIYLLSIKEAQAIIRLGSGAISSVNEAIESGLPETSEHELDEVLTTGLRVKTIPQESKRILMLYITDSDLSLERQAILKSVYDRVGKLPPSFKTFEWVVDWGLTNINANTGALTDKLEKYRPGSIKVGPSIKRKPKA